MSEQEPRMYMAEKEHGGKDEEELGGGGLKTQNSGRNKKAKEREINKKIRNRKEDIGILRVKGDMWRQEETLSGSNLKGREEK
jgi:hypothetical protein